MNKYLFSIIILITATKAEAQTSALAMADSLYAVGNYSEAIELLESSEPKSEAVYNKLAKAWQAKGNPAEALRNYRIVLQKSPERVLTAVAYGKLLSKTGKLQEADSIFYSLASKYPKNADFHFQRGLIMEKRNDSTALNHFMMALSYDRNHQQALYKIAKEHLRHRRYVRAEYLSKQGLEVNPANASLLSILAQTYFNQKLYDEAIPEFEKLVALNKGSEFIHSKLGYAYFQKKEPQKAIENYMLALDYEDMNAATHHALGRIYAFTGEYRKSEQHLLMAILIKDQSLEAEYLSLALTYKLKEDYKTALEYFNKTLDENPDNERALYERAIAADNYFKDLETRRNYYQAYLNKFGLTGSNNLVHLAKRRIKDINEELHLNR